jgi:hypothetical protein
MNSFSLSKENVVYIHHRVLFSHKEEVMSFVRKWMELEITMFSEISQIQKKNVFTHTWNLDVK